jgi:hypothetical protein
MIRNELNTIDLAIIDDIYISELPKSLKSTINVLRHILHTDDAEQLTKVQKELFMNCRNFRSDLGYNISDSLWHACFSTIHIHAHTASTTNQNQQIFVHLIDSFSYVSQGSIGPVVYW